MNKHSTMERVANFEVRVQIGPLRTSHRKTTELNLEELT